jgi:pSer/pThr/pTyr-binding forkhead associated (FHA) protein
MALTILVRSGEGTSLPRITFDAPRIVIGRGDGCEVRLPDPSVSHRHASIRQRGNEYIVMDEGSTNGTFVGSVRLSAQSPRVLKSGDLVRIGRVWIEARIEHAMPTQNAPLATREIALALVAEALAEGGEIALPKIRVVEGPGLGTELVVEAFDRAYVVGRGKSADLDIDDVDLSRRHVEIARKAEQIVVRDLGSKNGSSFDDRPLVANADTLWKQGAILRIGKIRLVCEDPVGSALEELEHAADERMAPSEMVDAPKGTPEPTTTAPLSGASGSSGSSGSSSASPSRPKSSNPPSTRRGNWTATDVLVALLALAVLGLSVAGLIWLIRGG